MEFVFELVSTGKYLRYLVISIENGSRSSCGYLDLTEEEANAFRFILTEGLKSYNDGELSIQFTANASCQAYLEGV